MERRILLVSTAALTLLSGCNFITQFMSSEKETMTEQQEQEQVQSSESSKVMDAEMQVRRQKEMEIKEKFGEEGGQYRDFEESDIGNGQESILFFHASWCPDCRRSDENLKDWYAANYIPLSVYKIDYDSAIGLKQRYGVVQQDTFVRIDGTGEAVSTTSFPTEIELLEMLRP